MVTNDRFRASWPERISILVMTLKSHSQAGRLNHSGLPIPICWIIPACTRWPRTSAMAKSLSSWTIRGLEGLSTLSSWAQRPVKQRKALIHVQVARKDSYPCHQTACWFVNRATSRSRPKDFSMGRWQPRMTYSSRDWTKYFRMQRNSFWK